MRSGKKGYDDSWNAQWWATLSLTMIAINVQESKGEWEQEDLEVEISHAPVLRSTASIKNAGPPLSIGAFVRATSPSRWRTAAARFRDRMQGFDRIHGGGIAQVSLLHRSISHD
jgi:hypothetical protein